MKKILFTMLCTAMMISCCGGKTKSDGCGDCTGNHTECTQQHNDCTGECDECTQTHGECTGNHEGCTSACDKKVECEAPAGCIQADNEMFMTRIADFNNPEWKYLGDKPAIIDFYASWCGPCKMVAPILEELAAEYGDSIVIYKVNTEKEQELSAAFGIRSIPTIVFAPMEGNPQVAQGAMGKAEFKKLIDEILLKK